MVLPRSAFKRANRVSRRIDELQAQLEFERLKREKLESELDECRTQIARLINTLRAFEEKKLLSRVRSNSFEGKRMICFF